MNLKELNLNFSDIQFGHNRAFLLLSNVAYPKTKTNNTLLEFLQQFPNIFGTEFPLHERVQREIISVLTFRLCNAQKEYFELILKPTGDQKRTNICGDIFKKGEGIYTCRDCGLDETCVMCTTCFKNSDHINHNTSFHYSYGSGGCCDCGDPEAWKTPCSCKIHAATAKPGKLSPLPKDLLDSVRVVVSSVIEMIIQVLESFENLGIPEDVNILKRRNVLDTEEPRLYCLILWNDGIAFLIRASQFSGGY
jgi:hypothetical protein